MVPFSSFMQSWLYGESGYYSSLPTIGKKGDFETSVTASMFFGGAIAKHFIKLIEDNKLSKNTTIIEIGSHHGYLMADIVQFIFTLKPSLLKTLKFAIIEPIKLLKEEQRRYLKDSFGDEVKFSWFDSLKEVEVDEAFVVCNELFDAFSCEVVKDNKMLYVDGFELVFSDIDEYTQKICNRYKITKGEVAKGYEEFCYDLSNAVKRCEFLTFDYGDKFTRGDISLRVYSKHKTYPFFALTHFANTNQDKNLTVDNLFKKSDITYDVNFLHLFDAFKDAGFKKIDFKTQGEALVDFGLIDLLEMLKSKVDENSYRLELSKVMQLIEPTKLGERFKMVRFQKGIA